MWEKYSVYVALLQFFGGIAILVISLFIFLPLNIFIFLMKYVGGTTLFTGIAFYIETKLNPYHKAYN